MCQDGGCRLIECICVRAYACIYICNRILAVRTTDSSELWPLSDSGSPFQEAAGYPDPNQPPNIQVTMVITCVYRVG